MSIAEWFLPKIQYISIFAGTAPVWPTGVLEILLGLSILGKSLQLAAGFRSNDSSFQLFQVSRPHQWHLEFR